MPFTGTGANSFIVYRNGNPATSSRLRYHFLTGSGVGITGSSASPNSDRRVMVMRGSFPAIHRTSHHHQLLARPALQFLQNESKAAVHIDGIRRQWKFPHTL